MKGGRAVQIYAIIAGGLLIEGTNKRLELTLCATMTSVQFGYFGIEGEQFWLHVHLQKEHCHVLKCLHYLIVFMMDVVH